MGRRGRPPTPTAIKIARGNPGKRRLNPREPKPPPGVPSCPEWIDKEAKACWRYIVPKLHEMGVLSKIERNALIRYCQTSSQWKRAHQFMQKHGETYPIKGEDGKLRYMQQFPQVAIANKAATALLRLEQEFGMTPASRSNIVATGVPLRDPLEQFVRKRERYPPFSE